MSNLSHAEVTSLKTLLAAAQATQKAIGLKYLPLIFRELGNATSFAAGTKSRDVVMNGDGAFWVVCPADATRLERAGFEWAC